MWMSSVAALWTIAGVLSPELPIVDVTADDTIVDRSCELRIAPGTVIADVNGDGVVRVTAPDVTVRFQPGSVLRGAAAGSAGDAMTGVGLVIDGQTNVRVEGAAIEGFKVGLLARGADGLVIDGAVLRDNFRQRLRSTPAAEDAGDWLWPHANDNREWVTNYGAAMAIERSRGVEVRDVRVREGQNGIILDRVVDSKVYDNDCSFLSGWGIAMWRSSGNVVSRNALDFCVRGYSHGVYNRGQDSAGLLMFEQCNGNLIAENSITHGGDGIFGFGGKEALGEAPGPEGFNHERKGCNDNLFVGNDLSYAPAHGLEMTFSFGNRIIANQFIENAICGIWGGYSQESLVALNVFRGNGSGGYGLERGGVNIEHGSGNTVRENEFEGNAAGVHLWTDEDAGLMKTPWAVKNHRGSTENLIASNQFKGDRVGIHLRATGKTVGAGNAFEGVGEPTKVEVGEGLTEGPAGPPVEVPAYAALGRTRPVGARAGLAGRQNIIVGEWGPWDHKSVMVRQLDRAGVVHRYEVWGAPEGLAVACECDGVAATVEQPESGPAVVRLSAGPGVHVYRAMLRGAGLELTIGGTLIGAEWTVRFFPWTVDPRENVEGWRAEAHGPHSRSVTLTGVRLAYRHAGPLELGLPDDFTGAEIGRDRFGTIATTSVPLRAGKWRVSTLSDDGVRVLVDGSPVIDNWTWHAPARDFGEFAVDSDRPVQITIEHFELDGFSVLEFEIEPAE
jgi:nitrous oxidase accessory protein NosD